MERIKQQLDVARKQREHIQQGYTTSSAHVGHRTWSAFSSEKHRFMAAKDKHIRLFLVITIAIISAMIIWWAVSSMEPEMRLSGIDLLESPQPVVKASSAVEMLEVKIDDLAKRVDILAESITHLETKLTSVHLTTDSIIGVTDKQSSQPSIAQQTTHKTVPVHETPTLAEHSTAEKEVIEINTLFPADEGAASIDQDRAPMIDTVTAMQSYPHRSDKPGPMVSDLPASRSTHLAETEESKDSFSNKQSPDNTDRNGPWVINLASTTRKTDADRLAKNALSKNIATEQQPITLNGTPYWRVQITGFSTAEDARAYAGIAREQLGLKDVWIMKR